MSTYLLTWNPKNWHWEDFAECMGEVRTAGYHDTTWSCGSTKKIRDGDRIFMLRQGKEPRGIFASGWSTSDVYADVHWDESRPSPLANYVDVRLDVLLDADREPIFPRQALDVGVYRLANWNTQMSGITIPEEVAQQLEKDWASFLTSKSIVQHHHIPIAEPLAGEVIDSQRYPEGATQRITVTIYERNREARGICIRHYGLDCMVCGFNFQQTYGEVGATFIHVHHLKPLSEIGREYTLDPIQDLQPVCPNCHAMLHRKTPPYSIEELRELLCRRQESNSAS
jgi:5-methylcytosine-specific restriction enzyme A